MDQRFLSSDQKLLESGLFSDVTVTCGSKTWLLHKNILCSRSLWFEKALSGKFEETATSHVAISDFEPRVIDWLISYIYTGVCDITKLEVVRKTCFVTCIEVFDVADYFDIPQLANLALDVLDKEFDAKLMPIQLLGEDVDYFDELLEAARLIYGDVPVTDGGNYESNLIRFHFVTFFHTARYYFLNHPTFEALLDMAPALALDLFKAMRVTGDFVANLPDPYCSFCKSKPGRGDKSYYTHLAPQKLTLLACCSICSAKKNLQAPTTDWIGKTTKKTEALGPFVYDSRVKAQQSERSGREPTSGRT